MTPVKTPVEEHRSGGRLRVGIGSLGIALAASPPGRAPDLVRRLLGGLGPMGAVDEVMSRFNCEWRSRALVIFFAFIPLFAVRELRRALGGGSDRHFLQRRSAAEARAHNAP
jgi:hypothetical protein